MKAATSFEDMYVVVHSTDSGIQLGRHNDHIKTFKSECIALAQGVAVLPYAEVASSFACETAIWGYAHVRQRPYYWENKIKLLQRIFRTVNLALWQKRKESNYSNGLASSLCLTILGTTKIWVGAVGNSRVYSVREGLVEELVPPESQGMLRVPMALGFVRTGIIPRLTSETLVSGDVILLCSDGIADVVTEEDIRITHELSGVTEESCLKSLQFIVAQARERGSRDAVSVCLIKKI